MTPSRIQLSRKKGFKLPANTVVVSRPSKWGNPFAVMADPHPDYSPQNAIDAVRMFRLWLMNTDEGLKLYSQSKTELRGKNLACWCNPGEPCHTDVLLEIANS